MIINKVNKNPKVSSAQSRWKEVNADIKKILSQSVCIYILRWILVLSMGVIGFLITKEGYTFAPYGIWLLAALVGGCGDCFVFAAKIAILIQMIALGIIVLVVVGWKLALVFIPLALIGWLLVPDNADDMPWY